MAYIVYTDMAVRFSHNIFRRLAQDDLLRYTFGAIQDKNHRHIVSIDRAVEDNRAALRRIFLFSNKRVG